MRIPISVQLALLVLSTSLVGLTVISVATWVNNYNFVIGVKSEGLSLTASLKAGEVASDLRLLQAKCSSIVTRVLVQGALHRFYAGNSSDANWADASTDISEALGSGGYFDLYQATVYSRNGQGDHHGLINVTGANAPSFALPYSYPNGSKVMLGDPELGYPPMLYPNLTYSSIAGQTAASDSNATVYAFPDYPLTPKSVLLLGPLQINDTLALVSFTLPIINNTSATELLGFMTVVTSAASIQDTLRSQQNLDSSAIVLLIGPARPNNLFAPNAQPATGPLGTPGAAALAAAQVRYVFEPTPFSGQADRHPLYNHNPSASFPLGSYPAALAAFSRPNPKINNASSNLSTKNEQNYDVAVGVARPQGSLADWVLIVEENHSDAWQPVQQLRKIILACVFGTAGFIALVVLPLAHFSVTPIRRLKSATEKTIQPSMMDDGGPPSEMPAESAVPDEKGNWIVERMRNIRLNSWRKPISAGGDDGRPKQFRVPGKVRERKHIVTDELTELTSTFNEMADELMIQYTRMEDRVAERTRELELSKKAAEMANESKTLFIANISHELKTPLNGILGMCAVCMGEDDLPRIKKSLQIVYKSGDLLLHLLNDLLTFSRNQIDQAIRLDEKEFSLSDIRSQLVTIFEKQVREKHIHFDVTFIGVNSGPPNGEPAAENRAARSMPASGPLGTGRLRDMVLWGDQHRILQILINLVSNSLKFTPDGGRVNVRIRCLGDVDKRPESSMKGSVDSKRASYRRSQTPSRTNSKGGDARPSGGALDSTFGQIGPHPQPDGWRTPPPINFRPLAFEFQVEDTGHGIPENLQQRVFEPFVQGDLGLNRKYGGTGLGLSICLQLSRLMDGSIALESTGGKGTIFTLSVPLKFIKEESPSTRSSSVGESVRSSISIEDPHNVLRPPSNGSPSTGPLKAFEQDSQPRLVGLSQPFFMRAPPSSSTVNSTSIAKVQPLDQVNSSPDAPGKIRVLVAEDNVVNQEVVLRMLKLEDIYDVTVAKDGQEAYETVKANMEQGKEFDLIFMDIQMPNLDGLQSTRLIRQMGYSAPIVALSAFAEESNIKDCIDSGMNMFLSKPIRRPALKQVLNKFATIIEEPETPSI